MNPPGSSYNLADAIGDKPGGYAATISDLIGKRCEDSRRVPGSVYLPTRGFTRSLGLGPSTDLVSTSLEAVAAAARPLLLLERLGAQRIELTHTGAVSLPAWVAGAGSGWVAEDAPAQTLQSTVRSVDASGRMAAARLAVSRKLQLQAAALEAVVLAELQAAVATTIEGGFLTGTGTSNQPLGLLNTPGVQQPVTFAAATPTTGELKAMYAAVADADANPGRLQWIVNAGDLMDAATWLDGTWRILGIPAHGTSLMPAGTYMLLDPTTVRTVYWDAPQLVVDKFSNGKSLSGAADLVVFNLCDVAAMHPAQIAVGHA